MSTELEDGLRQELHAVAEGLRVPALPALPVEPVPQLRRWVPLLVAAVAVLFVAGAAALGLAGQDRDEPEPAPPLPSPSVSPSATSSPVNLEIPTTLPSVPYLLGPRLYVDGEPVPGDWETVEFGTDAWLALRSDGNWWWGRTASDPGRLERLLDVPPVISPNGLYVGDLVAEQGGLLSGFDTLPGGEGLGGLPIDVGDRQDGTQVTVRAVTDDGRVIAQGAETAVLWRPLVDQRTVDLTETAPGKVVLGNTPAGLVVSDGEDGEPYLASISDDGVITALGALPAHDQLRVNQAGSWLAYVPLGTEGGEVTSFDALEAATVEATEGFSLAAPDGWAFAVRAWAWEDDDLLVARVVSEQQERLARCSVAARRCVLLDAP